MKKNIGSPALLCFLLFVFFSCEEGERNVDARDELVGSYGCMITQHDGFGRFLTQGNNAIRLIRKNVNPSIIDIVESGEVFCQVEVETAPGGFLLHVLPGAVDWNGSSEGYSIVDHVEGFYDQDGEYVEVVNDDPSFYDVKTNHFWLYYTILYNDTPIRFVVLDGEKM